MLDACKSAGWSRIHWRVLDGGRALYRSRLLRPMGRWDEDSFWNPQTDADRALVQRYNPGMSAEQRRALLARFDALDYGRFDPLAEAVNYGHRIGLKIHAWVTINEDDHGWGLQSDFSKRHPEFRWRRRNGEAYRSQLSFAFPEVRRYKLAIIKELLRNYAIDGLFIDWIRTGDVRDNPQNDGQGVADYGYEEPLVKGYESRVGTSPGTLGNGEQSWVQWRAQPQTIFMRELRQLARAEKRPMPISVLVGHPWHYRGEKNIIDGNLRGLLLDLSTWAAEGLIDAAVPAGYYRDGGSAEKAWHALRTETCRKVDVWMYAWVPKTIADFEESLTAARRVAAEQILFWEADYIEGTTAELKRMMHERAFIR